MILYNYRVDDENVLAIEITLQFCNGEAAKSRPEPVQSGICIIFVNCKTSKSL